MKNSVRKLLCAALALLQKPIEARIRRKGGADA